MRGCARCTHHEGNLDKGSETEESGLPPSSPCHALVNTRCWARRCVRLDVTLVGYPWGRKHRMPVNSTHPDCEAKMEARSRARNVISELKNATDISPQSRRATRLWAGARRRGQKLSAARIGEARGNTGGALDGLDLFPECCRVGNSFQAASPSSLPPAEPLPQDGRLQFTEYPAMRGVRS